MEMTTSCAWYTCAGMHGTRLETCLLFEDRLELTTNFASFQRLEGTIEPLADEASLTVLITVAVLYTTCSRELSPLT